MVPLTAAAAATLLGGSCTAGRVLGCCAVGLRGFLQQQLQQHRQHHRLASIQPGTESLQPAQRNCVDPAWPKLSGLVPLQYWGSVQQPSGRLPHTWLGSSSGSSTCSCRGFVTTPHAAADSGDAPTEPPRRRRRSATEGHTALRRTTESRAAIEDVAVMSKSQLSRRNKPWLAEQCWQQGLSHEGLKDDLIQRLLAWQGTDAGKAAAASAVAAAAEARAAVAAAAAAMHRKARTAVAPAAAPPAAATNTAAAASPAGSKPPARPGASGSAVPAAAPPSTAAAAAAGPGKLSPIPQLARPAAGTCAVAVALPADEPDDDADAHGSTHTATGAADGSSSGAASSTVSVSSSSSPASPVELFLSQLQEQPSNAAIIAAARNAIEQYAHQMLSAAAPSSHSSSGSFSSVAAGRAPADAMQVLVAQLAASVSQLSSPQSLAVLAKACYSREVQNPVLAASLAEAVAAVAAQLGPQEVFGVLRLLVEHLGSEAEDPVGYRTMDKGFRVLAEAMIRCSEALKPVQLAEAVQLLGVHKYHDAFGLWMIAKEAAARLAEFEPVKEGSSVVVLLDAIADMHVADDAMAGDVAAAVAARKAEYSQGQLAAINAALQRMGCSVAV